MCILLTRHREFVWRQCFLWLGEGTFSSLKHEKSAVAAQGTRGEAGQQAAEAPGMSPAPGWRGQLLLPQGHSKDR